MQQVINSFVRDESGAVTVDWVVLTAAIVGLGIAVIVPIASGTQTVGDGVGGALSDGKVAELDFTKIK